MNYLSIFDHNTRKRLAFLENAYKIGYKKSLNSLWSAQFTLPANDWKNKYCQPFNYVEIYDGDDYAGLFRIIPSEMTKDISTREITYQCEHVLATLIDDVLVGWHEIGNAGIYTNQVIQYLLERQTVTNWVLDSCEFSYQYLYGWEHENLLTALFSIPEPFTETYRWEFDTQRWPWALSLRDTSKRKTETRSSTYNGVTYTGSRTLVGATGEIRYRKNMLGISKTVDASNICTRLYPFGYGEGDNQLNISKVNNGKAYIDADTIQKYGVISKIWVDRRYQEEQALYDAAVATLEELKEPTVTYSVSSAHIGTLRDCDVGDIIRVIDDEEETSLYLPIQSIEKGDVTGNPDNATITLGGSVNDIAASIADLNDRQRIEETYSQGAVTLYSQSFRDNASENEPAEIRFYIPDNVVHINQIILQGRLTSFRGYTKATKGGGASADTTSSGGGGATTSEAGGGGSCTSSSDGAGSYTSEQALSLNAKTTSVSLSTGSSSVNTYTGSNSGSSLGRTSTTNSHAHTYNNPASHSHYVGGSHSHSIGSHEHGVYVGGHTHSFSVGSHTHAVSIPSHSHSVSIPAHSHRFSIPDHTHEIEYGIYKGTSAKEVTIKVDSNTVPDTFQQIDDLNIIPYLSTDKEGKISRGWHTLQVVPDTLTRIELDLVIQLFANSRGGGQY